MKYLNALLNASVDREQRARGSSDNVIHLKGHGASSAVSERGKRPTKLTKVDSSVLAGAGKDIAKEEIPSLIAECDAAGIGLRIDDGQLSTFAAHENVKASARLSELLTAVEENAESIANELRQRGGEAEEVAQATFRVPGSRTLQANLEFPACPGCGLRRYWLGRRGQVACSQCGTVRFKLSALEFHALQ